MNIFYQPAIHTGTLHLDEQESKHCARVMRKKPGDEIVVTDGVGHFYYCELIDTDQNRCTFKITRKESERARNFSVHIAIAPTKNTDRIEWFVEKAVEVGVDKITFIQCHNSERTNLKMERISKLAISAMKQSQRASLPSISQPTHFSDFIQSVSEEQKFIAHVDFTNPDHLQNRCKKGLPAITLIGPEGDFTEEELQLAFKNGFEKVSLGTARLRTETAGLMACTIMNLVNT